MCYAYAKENPVGFATFAMNVVSIGQGQFRSETITPSLFVKSNLPPVGMSHVDYVILSSMRCSLGQTGILENVLLTTRPSLLAGSMRLMGYKQVEEHILGMRPVKSFDERHARAAIRSVELLSEGMTFVLGSIQKSLTDVDQRRKELECLRLAKQKLTAGHVVIMGIDRSIENMLVAGSLQLPSVGSDIVSHWVVLRRLEYAVANPKKIRVTFISYGRRHSGIVNVGVLLTHFFGFVSGSPA